MEDLSLQLYDLLCNVVGTEYVIKTRRKLYFANKIQTSTNFFIVIPSGSKAEGLDMTNSDYDVMILDNTVRVFECTPNNISDRYLVCVMDYHNTKLGFTWLKVLNPDIKGWFWKMWLTVYNDITFLSRWHVQQHSLVQSSQHYDVMIHGPCVSLKSGEFEFLRCFRCHEWITSAQPWINRVRQSWPSTEIICRIINFGVLFVPVGCKNSPNEDLEWRISFSIAEKTLIYSFNHTQMLCYAAMKIILSDIIKPRHGELLCSYFLKTIMFWLAEEIDQLHWKPTNFVWCLKQCIKRLLYCVTYRICLHYFIPEINFFDGRFTELEHKQLLVTMEEVSKMGENVLEQTETIRNYKQSGPICSSFLSTLWMSLPKLVKRLTSLENYINRQLKFNLKSMALLLPFYSTYSVDHLYINVKDSNKAFHKQYKSISTHINLGLPSDAITGWSRLASFFYKCKQYMKCRTIIAYCLNKLTTDTILLTRDPYISKDESEMLCHKPLIKMIRHFVFGVITFFSDNILPDELLPLYRHQQRLGSFYVRAEVYLLFLNSLCLYHQGNIVELEDTISCLEEINNFLRDKEKDVYFKNVSHQCLSVAQTLLREIKNDCLE